MFADDALERWRMPGREIALSPGIVHVWRISTARSANSLEEAFELLDDAERERALRLADAGARLRFALTRSALRATLGLYLDVRPERLELAFSPHGKPEARVRGERAPIAFSVSHAHDLSLIAFALECRIGVDVERIRPHARADRIASRLFAPTVQATLAALSAEQRFTAFLRAWTQREAYVKAVDGQVFQTVDPLALTWPPPDDIEVQQPPNDESAEWSIRTFAPSHGYIATLVAEGRLRGIDWWSNER
ncbi:MAG: 4'-phosphopantetheinyl transferase family protein [Longimicrobiales bacterium]